MEDLYWAALFLSAIFIAYTQGFQKVTLFWGRRLASPSVDLPTGLQDAITPRAQTYRNIAVPILLVGLGIAGVILIGWYMAILGPLGTFILAGLLLSHFPKPEFGFYEKRILRSLENRRASYEKDQDAARLIAIKEIIKRFAALNPKKDEAVD
jgi:hypothetical protein